MIDFAAWNHMLKTYVNDQGQVDYGRWQQESLAALNQWLAAHQTVDVPALEQDPAIAFLINLYNALTIQQVLQQYPIRSIRPKILGMPNWLAFLRFFTQKRYTLNGAPVSLNNIEHDILRQRFQEPRLHFALVCASEGCPLLRAGAYLPESLNLQLEADAHRFIHNPDKVRFDNATQTLYCSKIFKWYQADFLAVADSIPAYICRYRPDLAFTEPLTVTYLPYSWQLNQRTSS